MLRRLETHRAANRHWARSPAGRASGQRRQAAFRAVYIGSGAATLLNTVVWGQSSGAMLAKAASATLTANHSLVKGLTLSGTGNLAGTTDPKLRSDGRLFWDSPLRAAGGSIPHSRIDMEGELRPASTPDIGADQYVDSDADELADSWELLRAGNLTTLTSRAQDADGDGLSNQQEYATDTFPTVADTDGDGLSDGDELNVHSTNPLKSDTDGDDMPDSWEVTHGLQPLVADAFDDADGDRYPNVFEYAYGTNPVDAGSKPTPNLVVNGGGGGTHTTVSAAVTAAGLQSGSYVIVGIAAGTYTGTGNVGFTASSSTKKLLIIGLEGAAKTIVRGGSGWDLYNTTVVASIAFQNMAGWTLWASASSSEFRFIDLLVKDSGGNTHAGAVHVVSAAKTTIVGSTFINNVGSASYANQVYIGSGAATLLNTVVWGQASGAMLAKAASATLTANHSLVKGLTLSGTGNLAGTTDPKLRSDGRLRSDSPLRGAGGTVVQSRTDADGELRPMSTPDLGVDQFRDTDADELPDVWEVASFGGIVVASGVDDSDEDDLNNVDEYDLETDPNNADTDGDGLTDGAEVAVGSNPRVRDSEEFAVDVNGDGLIESIAAQLGYQPHQHDSDGDGLSNADELLACTDPLRSDTDGDGVLDNVDPFPRDPLVSALPSNSSDLTPPIVTLTAPWYAIEQ